VAALLSWPLLFSSLFLTTQLVLSVRVLLRRSTLSNAHAWLLVLWLLPIVGMVLYLLIGENRLGSLRVRAYEKSEKALRVFSKQIWLVREQTWDGPYEPYHQLERLGASLCESPAVEGTKFRLCSDAAELLDAMIADIDSAESHCHLLTYIFQPSGKALDVVAALERASARGVECRVALDAAGSRAFFRRGLHKRLRSAGVEVIELLGVNPFRLLFRRLDLRNHRKIFIVDGKIAYTGSSNITDDTFRPEGPRGPGPWHDATVRLEGHAVRALALVFLSDWNSESAHPIDDPGVYLEVMPMPEDDRVTSAVQILPSGPDRRPFAIQAATVATMYAAKTELIVTTPYFVPDATVNTALITAAGRGVDVALVVPDRNNAPIVDHAGRASYAQLLDAGVRILRYKPGLLHAKTITIDSMVSLIGSANLDQRSFRINFEVTLAVYDKEFTSRLRTLQLSYIDQSAEVVAERWAGRPVLKRLADSAASLFGPIL